MQSRTADQWFDEYGESHQNPLNKIIHWLMVPIIYLTVLGLLWDIPVPAALSAVPAANFTAVGIAIALLFYFRLSLSIGIGMLAFSALCVALIQGYESLAIGPVWLASTIIFVVAWVFQFVGHKVEGAKPSFFKDLQFLLVGPAWLLGFIYRKLGIPY